ncbi:MAG: BamA/TamA family outer membrane protein [candidate division Zixibacteria bacterium]|nr:BamA/TamA family outer membrane protein [candidate division Zixibacteria bacterium]
MKQVVHVIILVSSLICTAHVSGNDRDQDNAIIDTLILSGSIDDTLTPGIPFSEPALTRLCDNLLTPWQDSGYYYAVIHPIRIAKNRDRISINAKVEAGPKVRIGRLLFSGLSRTAPATLHRYFPLVADSLLIERRLLSVAEAASRIGYLHFMEPIHIRALEGYTVADIECYFKEVRPVEISAGGGYVPDDPTGLVWHLDLRFNNLFGQGRCASLLSQRRERNHNELRLGYTQPVFWLGPGSAEFQVATRDYRDLFYEFLLRSSYRLDRWRETSTALSLAYRSVEPVGDRSSFSVYAVEHQIQWRTLDNIFNPSRGVNLNWSLLYSYRRHKQDSAATGVAFDETRIAISISTYQPLVGSLTGHIGLRYRGLETEEDLPPVSELVLVGGPGSLRGYRNEQFAVVRAAIITVEPRLRFESGYIFGFADGAYLNNRVADADEGVRTQEDFHWGFGIGIAVQSATRGVRISLGLNPDTPIGQARLSIEISSEI